MGVHNTVLSDVIMKGGSESTLTKALNNSNEYVKAMDLKKGKKDKNAKKEPKKK